MNPIKFHPEAKTELREAARYYQSQKKGLGRRFLTAIRDATNRIQTFPLLYRSIEEDVRQCRVLRFLYGLIYRIGAERIEIIAVMHLHRDPGHWKWRLHSN